MLRLLALVLLLPSLAAAQTGGAVEPWPAEPESAAQNLSSLDADLGMDLSGAFWNEQTGVLWTCRNGPTDMTSKIWSLAPGAAGAFAITGEWTGFGDLEDVAQADLDACTVFGIVEGTEQRVKAWNLCGPEPVLENDWNTKANIPQDGGRGAEGLAFVPDAILARAGFVDASGNPYTSTQGMGGLMFVGHQGGGPDRRDGGGVYVFDLNRADSTFSFVGEYRMFQVDDATDPANQFTETPALSLDRSTGLLYAWHGEIPMLTVHDLSSVPVAGQAYRMLKTLHTFQGPNPANPDYEGIAVLPATSCAQGIRNVFMTVDDGAANAFFRYAQFRFGCPDPSTPTPTVTPTTTASPTPTPHALATPSAAPSPVVDPVGLAKCRHRMEAAWASRRYCERTRAARGASTDRCDDAWRVTYARLTTRTKSTQAICRFADGGDGTVTDYATGLQWTKLRAPTAYAWAAGAGDVTPDGSIFADFLGALDAVAGGADPTVETGGFAGHHDWRLPTTVDVAATADILSADRDALLGAIFGTATDQSFWSMTTVAGDATEAWSFEPGASAYAPAAKSASRAAVAVRDAL
ncbi:MAG TPA: DUF1566 domain-containing protein [Candidatus Binatia bacterium]|jgi:hypothetical protein